MARKICVGLIALPVLLCNTPSSFANTSTFFRSKVPVNPTTITTSVNTDNYSIPVLLSGRDDKTPECLRLGTCNN
jgi:hypothetical protein